MSDNDKVIRLRDITPLLNFLTKGKPVIVNDDHGLCGRMAGISSDGELAVLRHEKFKQRVIKIPFSDIRTIEEPKRCKIPKI